LWFEEFCDYLWAPSPTVCSTTMLNPIRIFLASLSLSFQQQIINQSKV
jgi:hypothetical protein